MSSTPLTCWYVVQMAENPVFVNFTHLYYSYVWLKYVYFMGMSYHALECFIILFDLLLSWQMADILFMRQSSFTSGDKKARQYIRQIWFSS